MRFSLLSLPLPLLDPLSQASSTHFLLPLFLWPANPIKLPLADPLPPSFCQRSRDRGEELIGGVVRVGDGGGEVTIGEGLGKKDKHMAAGYGDPWKSKAGGQHEHGDDGWDVRQLSSWLGLRAVRDVVSDQRLKKERGWSAPSPELEERELMEASQGRLSQLWHSSLESKGPMMLVLVSGWCLFFECCNFCSN